MLVQAVKPQEVTLYTWFPCTRPALVIPDIYGAQLAPRNGFFWRNVYCLEHSPKIAQPH